jgi:hypothetical protein
MDRALELGAHECGHRRQRAGDEAFHVRRAAPVEPTVALDAGLALTADWFAARDPA